MNTFKKCLWIILFLSAVIQSAVADPIYLGIYPTSVKVAYGATAQIIDLPFYLVNDVSTPHELSDFALVPVSTPHEGAIKVKITNDCNNHLGPAGKDGVCNITATVTAKGNPVNAVNFLTPVNYQFHLNYKSGGRVQHLTSPVFPISFATGQLISSAARTFTFNNNSNNTSNPQIIWLGISSGAVNSIKPDSVHPTDLQSCVSDSDCYAGSKCINVAAGLNHCLWENPAPVGGATGYELAAGDSTTVSFPMYDNGIDPTWSGGIAARIGCTGAGGTCTVADCGASSTDGACVLGTGFQTPNTTAEFTLQGIQALVTNTSGYPDNDTYDITIINGITGGGLSMGPTQTGLWSASNPYKCATPGTAVAQTPLGACDWSTIAPPTSPLSVNGKTAVQGDYIWVGSTTEACPSPSSPNGGCTSPQVCGHPISGSTVGTLACGTQLGLLTADAICAKDASFGDPFDCAATFVQNMVTYTNTEVYGCSIGDFKHSCYSTGAASSCCGCDNWWEDANYPAVIPSANTQTCNNTNTNWQSIAEPTLSWLKQACPTAYTFPYDDASSTFTCQVLNANHINTTNYTITFAPAS